DTWDRDLAADIFVMPAAGGEAQRLTQTGPSYDAISWQPDGSRIAFAVTPEPMNEPRHPRVGVVDPDTGALRILTGDLHRNASPYTFAGGPGWDGSTIYFRVEDAGNVHLMRVDADGTAGAQVVVGGEG